MALYFVTVRQSTTEYTFYKHPSSWPVILKRFKMVVIIRFELDISEMSRQDGCCTTVVVQNEIQIHQQNRDRPTFICNNLCISNKPNPILRHPAVLDRRKLARPICFSSHLFYFQFAMVKI